MGVDDFLAQPGGWLMVTFGGDDLFNIISDLFFIPGSSGYVKFLPFGRFFG